ncbi:TPA: uracil-DNA glycosylase [Patescibacteria group bacterium]|nr:uracil-DNA glycosylase [Patescibacteria group bacterium]|tara:strand:- start:6686 stop:7285 length:600 start_codon:yes stop_codon:yes gene_type:complete
MGNDRSQALKQIREEVQNLKESPLYQERVNNQTLPVIGEGSHNAQLMFIGEAPGRNEAKTGRPFCGSAGKILDDLLTSIGVKREAVYITNIVKDRPPSNRDPLPEEIAIYGPFLDRQIDIIKPLVIVTLGRFSMSYIMEKQNLQDSLQPISELHGQVLESKSNSPVKVAVMYHPAAAIYNPKIKKVLHNDFQILPSLIK